MIYFEWDENKARHNLRKHRVSFTEAQSVFYDENAMQFFNAEHTDNEDRFLLLGLSHRLRILVVIHTDNGEKIRIISARKATKREVHFYPGSH